MTTAVSPPLAGIAIVNDIGSFVLVHAKALLEGVKGFVSLFLVPVIFVEGCKNLCLATRSGDSKYIAAGMDNLEQAFDSVDATLNSGVTFDRNCLQHGLTMEKF